LKGRKNSTIGQADPTFALMFRMLLALALVCPAAVAAQGDSTTALLVAASWAMNGSDAGTQEAINRAWAASFGREPGAGRAGAFSGSAHFNFRSATLTGREETMGRVTYSIHIDVSAVRCRVTIGPFRHAGNRDALRGGTDLGLVTSSGGPVGRTPGLSKRSATAQMAQLRDIARARAEALLDAFGAQLPPPR